MGKKQEINRLERSKKIEVVQDKILGVILYLSIFVFVVSVIVLALTLSGLMA